MNLINFIEATPFLYHLTDAMNYQAIISEKAFFSMANLLEKSSYQDKEVLVRERRPTHVILSINGENVHVRDQRPLNRALDKCLTPGWTREDFIRLLNGRVFLWPNITRLTTHFNRYATQEEQPVIFRFATDKILNLNHHVTFCRLNSGATRPNSYLGGIAPVRGEGTFVSAEDFNYGVRGVVEVTFENQCIIPEEFSISNNPDGPWEHITLNHD